jgi:hypothetical protein
MRRFEGANRQFRCHGLRAFRFVRRVDGPLHVRLTRAEPHFADKDIRNLRVSAWCGDNEFARFERCLHRGKLDRETTVFPRDSRCTCRSKDHFDALARQRCAAHWDRSAPLQNRVVAEQRVEPNVCGCGRGYAQHRESRDRGAGNEAPPVGGR